MIEVNHQQLLRVILPVKSLTGVRAVPTLRENEIVEASVMHSTSSDSTRLLVKGKRINVAGRLPFKAGSAILLKVIQITPRLVLRHLNSAPKGPEMFHVGTIFGAIKENLWKNVFEPSVLLDFQPGDKKRLQKFMRRLTSRLYLKSGPNFLKSLVDHSGYNWEAKLATLLSARSISPERLTEMINNDLKGMISRYLHENEKEAPELKRLLRTIASVQMLNQGGLRQSGRLFFPLPIQFPDGFFTVAELLLQKEPAISDEHAVNGAGEPAYRVAFRVELSVLGPLRVDLVLKGKSLDGSIMTSTGRAQQIIEAELASFVEKLRASGFKMQALRCVLSDPEHIEPLLVNEIMQEGDGGLCLVA